MFVQAMEYATISDTEQIEFYVTSSIKNAFTRVNCFLLEKETILGC